MHRLTRAAAGHERVRIAGEFERYRYCELIGESCEEIDDGKTYN